MTLVQIHTPIHKLSVQGVNTCVTELKKYRYNQNLPGSKLPLLLDVNSHLYMLSFSTSLSNPCPFFFFDDSLKRLQIWWSYGMDPGPLPNKNQVGALCRPVRIVRFSLLEVVLHQAQHIFWVVVLEDKAMTQTQFCCWLLAVFVQNLLIILLSSFTSALMRFTVPDALKHLQNIILPPPFFTVGTVFFVLYASVFFLQELHFHLIWPKDVHPEWITIFQVLLCRV